MKGNKPDRQRRPGMGASIALVLFFLFLLLFGALVLRYALGLSLKDRYLRGPAQGMGIHQPYAPA
ncbi:MAG TPA: hypothetical protein VLA21_06570 [Candidatus Limnocylindria bacterium]|nr:hypothetical protein [Candidatus Limnocylindria bacterium]